MTRDGHFSDQEGSRDCDKYSWACAALSGESVVSPVVFRASHHLPPGQLTCWPSPCSCPMTGAPCSPSDPAVLPLPPCLCTWLFPLWDALSEVLDFLSSLPQRPLSEAFPGALWPTSPCPQQHVALLPHGVGHYRLSLAVCPGSVSLL